MKNGTRLAIVALLALAVAATVALRGAGRFGNVAVTERPAAATRVATGPVGEPAAAAPGRTAGAPVVAEARPRLLELGSVRCQTCLQMAKVLEELRASQGARLQVDFIDVYEQPEAPERYRISLIPTQILYDGAGKEIFRHSGFFSHDDVLAKFRALGVRL
jgi:thioredoxin 1